MGVENLVGLSLYVKKSQNPCENKDRLLIMPPLQKKYLGLWASKAIYVQLLLHCVCLDLPSLFLQHFVKYFDHLLHYSYRLLQPPEFR